MFHVSFLLSKVSLRPTPRVLIPVDLMEVRRVGLVFVKVGLSDLDNALSSIIKLLSTVQLQVQVLSYHCCLSSFQLFGFIHTVSYEAKC